MVVVIACILGAVGLLLIFSKESNPGEQVLGIAFAILAFLMLTG